MALYQRGEVYWIDFTTRSGKRTRCSTQTNIKKEAEELHDKLKSESWRQSKLGDQPRRKWDEAALRWIKSTNEKKSHRDDISRLRWVNERLSGKWLDEITDELILELLESKRSESSSATANRHGAVINAILTLAKSLKWIVDKPKVKRYKEPENRIRWLTPGQFETLLDMLPLHQRACVMFALATGLRQSNVLQLQWADINMERKIAWVHPDKNKSGKALGIPLNETAMMILDYQKGEHPGAVFTHRRKPIRNANTRAWRKALARAGIVNFRWHDLRHTWASWLVQNKVTLYQVQQLGGWKDIRMVQRYAHLSPENLTAAVGIIDGTLTTQEKKQNGLGTA